MTVGELLGNGGEMSFGLTMRSSTPSLIFAKEVYQAVCILNIYLTGRSHFLRPNFAKPSLIVAIVGDKLFDSSDFQDGDKLLRCFCKRIQNFVRIGKRAP